MPISCHFRDCKALLVTSLTHVSGAIAGALQTSTFTLPADLYLYLYLYLSKQNDLLVEKRHFSYPFPFNLQDRVELLRFFPSNVNTHCPSPKNIVGKLEPLSREQQRYRRQTDDRRKAVARIFVRGDYGIALPLPFPRPSRPLLHPSLPLPSTLLPSPPLPFPPPSGGTSHYQIWGLGSAVSSPTPQRGPKRSPGRKRIFGIFRLRNVSGGSNFASVMQRKWQSSRNTYWKQEVKVIWQKAPHGGRKLYDWIPGVGFPISVP